jgi:RimJ/RimL family protein N-acetyltransferase
MPDAVEAGPILLRRRTAGDAAAILSAIIVSLPELAQWFAWAQREPQFEDLRERAAEGDRNFAEGADYEFVLVEIETMELVGGLRLNPRAGENTAEIGYWVRSDRTGRGHATAATRGAATAAFAHLPHVDQLIVRMDAANVASAAIPRKLGFRLDHEEDRPLEAPAHTGRGYVWAMTPSEWNCEGAR